MKTSVYISGPITEDKDYKKKFFDAETMLRKAGYFPVNPALIGSLLPEDLTHKQYMKIDLAILEFSDVIYFLKGWENSKGCREEFSHAVFLRKTMVFEK